MAWNKDLICPDVSFYQDDNTTVGQIDFIKMKAAGAVGVIIRAGQNTWIDPDFRFNWRAAKEAGLPRGTYWFYDSRNTPKNQATLFLSVVGSDFPELGYWLDLEEGYGATYRGWQNWKICLKALSESSPNVGVYTAPAYWKEHRPADPNELTFFGQYPLWVAHYGVLQPSIPAPWTEERTWFWQYTSKGDGLKYGVESLNIDLSQFNGSPEDFHNRFGGVIVSPPTGVSMWKKATGNITIRTGPGTTYPNATINGVAQYVLMGDVLEVSEITNGFAHIVRIIRNGVEIAIPDVSWCGTAYLVDTEAPAPDISPLNFNAVLAPGSTITVTNKAGEVLWTGTAK